MYLVFSRTIALATALLFISGLVSAQSYLTFHTGAGANDQFFDGGIVENRGNQPISRAYVSILPVNERCELLPMAWKEFGPIPAHSKIEFRVPVNSALTQYHLAGFKVFDDMGFALDSVDEIANIIKAREHQERRTWQAKRQ